MDNQRFSLHNIINRAYGLQRNAGEMKSKVSEIIYRKMNANDN